MSDRPRSAGDFRYESVLATGALHLGRLTPGDAEALRGMTEAEDFRYFLNLVPRSMAPDDFAEFVRELASGSDRIPVVARLAPGGEVVACSSWMDLRPAWRCLEIGMTWIARPWRGTFVNPALKRAMLAQAFEDWSCIRVTLKCDARNAASRGAILKLGAQPEGVLRSYGIQNDGTVRDTAMFSILADEWPAVRDRLDARIDATREGDPGLRIG